MRSAIKYRLTLWNPFTSKEFPDYVRFTNYLQYLPNSLVPYNLDKVKTTRWKSKTHFIIYLFNKTNNCVFSYKIPSFFNTN